MLGDLLKAAPRGPEPQKLHRRHSEAEVLILTKDRRSLFEGRAHQDHTAELGPDPAGGHGKSLCRTNANPNDVPSLENVFLETKGLGGALAAFCQRVKTPSKFPHQVPDSWPAATSHSSSFLNPKVI